MKIFINFLLLFLFISGGIGYYIDFIPSALITDHSYINVGFAIIFGYFTFYVNKEYYYITLQDRRKSTRIILIIFLIGLPSSFFYLTSTRTGPMIITSIVGEDGTQEFHILEKKKGRIGRHANRCRYHVKLSTGDSSLSQYKICNIKRSIWNIIAPSDTIRVFGKNSFAGIYVEKTQILKP